MSPAAAPRALASPDAPPHSSTSRSRSRSSKSTHSHSPPSASRSEPDDPLPHGWVKQFDPASQRDFYVDTAGPRSTWVHPYKDPQYLREHGARHNIRRHSAASQGIASPVLVGGGSGAHCSGEPARKKPRLSISASDPVTAPASPPSVHEDLTSELDLILRRDFSFQGRYAHAATTASAANPGLHVKGLGVLGLPLSARDARLVQDLIAANSNPDAPGGGGGTGGVGKGKGAKVWELSAHRDAVACANPAWAAYLEAVVLTDLWAKLAPCAARPRLALQALLLWEATPEISEYVCTEDPGRADGDRFATVHVILPSTYTGGNVHLSYAGCAENYDLSATSSFSTSFVAWHHGVDCAITPIESGRRLALSYHLVAGAGPDPAPRLPAMPGPLLALRRFLLKWSALQEHAPGTDTAGRFPANNTNTNTDTDADTYTDTETTAETVPSVLALPLRHAVRDGELLRAGADALRREDRHRVLHLKPLCDELGFALGLATLDDHLIGVAHAHAHDAPRMRQVTSRRLTIREVLDFDGAPMEGLTKLELEERDLDPHVIEFHFYRTVAVLFERRRTVAALLHTRRTPYALERLAHVDRRPGANARAAPEDRAVAAYVLAALRRQQPYNFAAQAALADIALAWGDVRLWNGAARSTGPHGALGAALGALQWLAAWRRFGFAAVRERRWIFFLETDPEAFLALETGVGRDGVLRWSTDQLQKALDTMQHLERDEAPVFIALIRKKGVQFFWHVVMRSITRVPNAYEFWVEFLRTLYTIRPENTNSDEDVKMFDLVTDEGLDTIISDFSLVVRSGDAPRRHQRLTEIIDLCLATRRLDMCRRVLFITVPRDQGADWVADILSPLYVPPLRSALRAHDVDPAQKPFDDFFRAAIGCYLHHVLGAYSGGARRVCGACAGCAALDEFLLAPRLAQAHFVGAKASTNHLQTHLMAAADVASYYRIADPAVVGGNVLIVDKRESSEAGAQWRARKARALEFLAAVGERAVVERIMGRRYGDVVRALEGKARFRHMEDAARERTPSPARGLAIHHVLQGRWVVTSVTDVQGRE
ncbi:hypothetical protein B0H15DRAFT_807440 [Mycena belliarum]|uniref:WW domain-containing protein n=1 Tax=Mycena belliarum TaxID=1033014 RepID=A0AAD6XHU8_9AGAR|nr:hypothetical protein B0H15DRAFT_807440 [Mycena belliae]